MQWKTLETDRPFLENKYHKTDEPFEPLNRMAYHGWAYDPATGMDDDEMRAGIAELLSGHRAEPHCLQKARALAYVLDNARVDIHSHDYFIGLYNWGRLLSDACWKTWEREIAPTRPAECRAFMQEGIARGAIDIWGDYDHSVPDWHFLYQNGFPGVLSRIQRVHAEKQGTLTADGEAFFAALEMTYTAVLRFLDRLIARAGTETHAKAAAVRESLCHLRAGAPQTTYDALQLIYIYFIISECVDAVQVRSLGSGLDHDLLPFYEADIAAGRYTADEIAEFIGYFFMQFSAIGNYWGHPLYLGGTNLDGTTRVNAVSYLILDVYRALHIYNPKLQIKYGRSTPPAFVRRVLDMLRAGGAGMVIVCEDNVLHAFETRGIGREECFDFDIRGCYEYGVRAAEVATAPLYINLLRGVLDVFEDDMTEISSYAAFEAKYFEKMRSIYENGMRAANAIEETLDVVNPTLLFSGTSESSLERVADVYQTGAKYEMTDIVNSGLASAVDALMAVKTLVFDEQRVTLPALRDILAADWAGQELLRRYACNLPCKYGNNHPETTALTERIADFILSYQGRPNARGGSYKMFLHSARMFIAFGKRCGATPDGRHAGEETSKNGSPTPGTDTAGATALILSALHTHPDRFAEGHCLDVMLHPSAVTGEDGLTAMKALVDVYAAGGGASIQFNIVDAATLRAAQREPEKYRDLQIRVCGWNVLFRDMCKAEQDKYIERAERI